MPAMVSPPVRPVIGSDGEQRLGIAGPEAHQPVACGGGEDDLVSRQLGQADDR